MKTKEGSILVKNSSIPYWLSNQRHGAKGIKRRDIYIIGAFIIGILLVTNLPSLVTNSQSVLSGKVTQTSTIATSTGNNLCVATKPLQVTEFDAFGSAFNAPTGILYYPTPPYVTPEGTSGPTFSSSGVATTSGKYSSGTALAWKFSGASQVTQWVGGPNNTPFIVPYMTCGDTSTNNVLTIYGITLAAYTIAVSGPAGTTFTSGNQYYFSQFPGGATATQPITILLTVNTKNQGYRTTWDFTDTPGLWMNMIVQIKDTAANLVLTGLPRGPLQFGAGTTRYWPVACGDGLSGTGYGAANGVGAFSVTGSDSSIANGGSVDSLCQGSLTFESIGTTNYGAAGATITFNVAKGSLAASTNEALAISMWDYGSIAWWIGNGVYGPNAAQLGAPQGSSAGTAFILNLMNA